MSGEGLGAPVPMAASEETSIMGVTIIFVWGQMMTSTVHSGSTIVSSQQDSLVNRSV